MVGQMASSRQTVVDELADLPHARQLQAGFPWLRFEPPLEAAFRCSRFDESVGQVRASLGVAALLVMVFTAINSAVLGVGLSHVPAMLNWFVKLPAIALTLASTWLPNRHRAYPPIATAAALACGLSQVAIITLAALGGQTYLFPSLLLTALYIYFMCGLTFYYAVAANSLILWAYLATAPLAVLPDGQFEYAAVVLLVANLMGAMLLYMHERSGRQRFLESSLLRDMATRDGLTGIHNRRMFDQHIELVWNHAVRDAKRIAVLLVDIDFFKDYNDRYGHQAGDESLRCVAVSLSRCARRPMDAVVRFGGEEFAVVLYDATSEYVEEVAARVQRAIAELNIPHQGSTIASHLTTSIGAACIQPTASRSPDGLIQLADEALYAAKKQGRNRVVVMQQEYQALTTGRFRSSRRSGTA